MRIISGEYGGRHLKSLSGDTTRPTTDKVKESIFNIIGPYFDGGIVFDLYGGSGALSIEAISRGMEKAFIFESDRKAQLIIEENIKITKEIEKFKLIKGNSQRMIAQISVAADLVFLDPPYAKQTIVADIQRLHQLNLLKSTTIIVCETDQSTILPEQIEEFVLWKKNTYGATAVWFYEGK